MVDNKLKGMKKIFILLIVILSSLGLYSQVNYQDVKTLTVREHFNLPSDTIRNPKKRGEIRYKSSDSSYYEAMSITGPKRWRYLGGEVLFSSGSEDANFRSLFKIMNSGRELMAKSISIQAVGGLVSTPDSNASQSWWTISLPDQTGQAGKVLGTDGTNATWVTAGAGSGVTTVTALGTGLGSANGLLS